MKKLLNAFFISILFGIPMLSYVFLDQLYVRRFTDFSHKWMARESQHLKSGEQTLSELLKRYEDVVLVSDDLRGFGIAKGSKINEFFGEGGLSLPTRLPLETGEVLVQRIGFLEYRTMVLVNPSDATVVFFNFQDDTAVFDLLILIFAMLSSIGVAVFARARSGRLKEATIQKTTIRTIQGMAHDFRAPFGKLRIFLTQLEHLDSPALSKLKSNREALDAAVDHADDILTDFLSLDTTPEAAPFEGQQLTRRLETKYFHAAKEEYPEVELRFDCPEVVWALGNEHKTLRVLSNLLDNALKHAYSQVELSIKLKDDGIVFCVTNDGVGIPRDQLAAIFKPFYSKRKGGLGLGLFICDTFVKAQGAKLSCVSSPGSTRFSFTLPLGTQVQLPQKASTQTSDSQYHIAYVDDEKFYRNALESTLKDSQVSVSLFQDTDSLLLALKSERKDYDLLLADRFGPTFDAVEDRFQESCRDYGYEGPIVLYSNSVTRETEFSGFTKVLDKTKSISADDILNIIGEFKNETK